MYFNFEEYKDKTYACWIGKNIGEAVNDVNRIVVEVSVRGKPNCGYLQTILIG